MSSSTIKIEVAIKAPPQKVWTCYTEPEHITQWNFANNDWYCPSATNELHVGGRYCARMEAKDGTMGFDFEAIYDEVSKPTKLAYTLSDGRKIVTQFSKEGEYTTVSTVFEAESQNDSEMQRAGWQSILDNFKHYVETNGQ